MSTSPTKFCVDDAAWTRTFNSSLPAQRLYEESLIGLQDTIAAEALSGNGFTSIKASDPRRRLFISLTRSSLPRQKPFSAPSAQVEFLVDFSQMLKAEDPGLAPSCDAMTSAIIHSISKEARAPDAPAADGRETMTELSVVEELKSRSLNPDFDRILRLRSTIFLLQYGDVPTHQVQKVMMEDCWDMGTSGFGRFIRRLSSKSSLGRGL